ncbi:hypothetical protein BKN38_01375 [Helicobacter sp. CLO-3]|uniref:hypothetical protein n=1 Tax=unclassified Helicobacter TaxID=2593540 RepID=UPI000805114E|nr:MULTISPECIES: hypothetical protein [unclassified Helicobacter]OBV29763.1 hypothetical protein BA723_00180 [Helicobacter sp. CLO-3]OHU85216.1 hypothetical protein BKN38_01375 [Helicobacter sp. CLO-3]
MKYFSCGFFRHFSQMMRILCACVLALFGAQILQAAPAPAQAESTPAQSTQKQAESKSLDSSAPSAFSTSKNAQGIQNALGAQGIQSLNTPAPSTSQTPQNAIIDSSQIEPYSIYMHRYNTRFDKPNNIRVQAIGGGAKIFDASSYYGGGVFTYDGIIDRYPLGMMVAYLGSSGDVVGATLAAQNTTNSINQLEKPTLSHTAQLGLYSDMFLEAHHISLFAAQSFNAMRISRLDSALESSKSWLISSTTNAEIAYGYVFALNSAGSFIEPLARFHLHTLFNIEKNSLDLPTYILRSNIELGVKYQQFMGAHVLLYITPVFRQDIGIIGADIFSRMMAINADNSVVFALPDSKYRSQGVLSFGLEFRAKKNIDALLGGYGIYTSDAYAYGANLGIKILF